MHPQPVEGPKVLSVNARHCAVGAGSTLIQLWEETVVEDVEHARTLVREYGKTRPGLSSLVIVSTASPVPDAQARTALEALAKEFPADARCFAYAYEGKGMRATAIRSIMTLLGLLQPRPLPVKVHATVDEALAWMAQVLGDRGSEDARLRPAGVAVAREALAEAMRRR